MKASARVFMVLGCCAVVAAVVYPILSHEPAGAMMLAVFAGSLLYLGRELYRGAETDLADDAQAQAQVGPEHVFPSSWWPLVMALGIALGGAGLIFTPVLAGAGGAIFIVAVVGWLQQQADAGHETESSH